MEYSKSVKVLLGSHNEGLEDCDIVLQMDDYTIVNPDIHFCQLLKEHYGFDPDMTPAYARRIFDSFSDQDLRKYLRKLYKSLPNKAIIHTDDIHFAHIVKEELHGDLIRVALYGINPKIPLSDKAYDAVLVETSNLNLARG